MWTAQIDRKNLAARLGRPMALVITGDGSTAIDCTGSAASYDGDKANARLIASAPELFAALEMALEPCERGECCPVCDEQPHNENCLGVFALKKARGEK